MADTVNKLYCGEVTINFSEHARNRYVTDGTTHSPLGVTTVLQTLNKPALMLWPLNEAMNYLRSLSAVKSDDLEVASKKYLDKSYRGKNIGTEIHACVERFLRGEIEPTAPTGDVLKAFGAFSEWYNKQNIRPLSIEKVVYSRNHDFAGTYDSILSIDGQTVLCDLKTTNASRSAPRGIYAEHFLQLGAYSLAFKEEMAYGIVKDKPDYKNAINYKDIFPQDLMVINCSKDGKVNTLRASEIGLSVKQCEDLFLKVLELYRYVTPISKKLGEMK